jgi:hypothetical protein
MQLLSGLALEAVVFIHILQGGRCRPTRTNCDGPVGDFNPQLSPWFFRDTSLCSKFSMSIPRPSGSSL